MTATKGLKEKGWLEFKYMATGEPIRFPVGTVHGVNDGPTLLVLGGMHGSEFAGIEAAIRLFNEVDPQKLSGTLKIGMIYNMPAFVNNLGFLIPHDGKNPMSTFPGSPIGTYGEVMAYYFDQEMLSKTDYFVELHGGDIPEALTPFSIQFLTGDANTDEKSRKMAEVYNIPLLVTAKLSPNDPPKHACGISSMRGKPSVFCESGQQGILKMEEVETHLIGLRNVLIHLGMMQGEIVNTVKRKHLTDYTAVRSEHVGMWYPDVKLNQLVKKDQVVGQIRDYFGDPIFDVKAKLEGIITMIRTSPAVKIGNVLIEHAIVTFEET
ncbi:MAG: succinylglutamate desuccinylase/aspartoacylase family protein [Anaerolineaceae bacterium]|nr:succinylglutamate desuccinylase/aspartoacylase family protein [Anaerolineaceae bacterium]